MEGIIQKPRSGERGFTLIELMVILLVVGILAAVVGVGVVVVKPKSLDIPFGGLRTTTVGDIAPPCDVSELEQLEQLPPEGKKVLEPTYKERAQKDLGRVQALETKLEGLKAEKAALKEQPASSENRDKRSALKDKIFQAERDLETYRRLFDLDTECLLAIAADTASPLPAEPSPTPTPASTRTPVLTQPKPRSPAPPPAVPSTPVPSTPEPVGVEPPSRGPPDSG